MNYNFGDVVLMQFPQSGKTARKQRPGIVLLDIGDADVVVAPVTSKNRNQTGDFAVGQLQNTGLVQPSCIRLAKVATLLKTDVAKKLGRLSSEDRTRLAQTWQSVYGDFVS